MSSQFEKLKHQESSSRSISG